MQSLAFGVSLEFNVARSYPWQRSKMVSKESAAKFTPRAVSVTVLVQRFVHSRPYLRKHRGQRRQMALRREQLPLPHFVHRSTPVDVTVFPRDRGFNTERERLFARTAAANQPFAGWMFARAWPLSFQFCAFLQSAKTFPFAPRPPSAASCLCLTPRQRCSA